MKTKILVHGKSQSRTALGIINAYLKLYPGATPLDVQVAFPRWLNRRCTANNLIIPVEKTVGYEKMFFEHEDELIVFSTGETYALVEVWDKDDFNSICKHAKQYGIEAAKVGTKPFEKGSFELEYLNGNRAKCPFRWWCILLFILLLLLIIFCCRKCCCNNASQNPNIGVVENVTTVQSNNYSEPPVASTNNLFNDNGASISITLPDGNIFDIAKNSQEYKLFSLLNSSDSQIEADQTKGWITLDKVHFEKGKANFASDSENQLKSVAMIMQLFPNSRFKIGGYTDNTGSNATNMKLSTERAKVSAEKLISYEIAENRITHEGYGAQRPVCPPNDSDDCRAENRRVEVKVTHK